MGGQRRADGAGVEDIVSQVRPMIDAADDQVERPAAQRVAQTDVGARGWGAGQPVRYHVFGMTITVVVREVGKERAGGKAAP